MPFFARLSIGVALLGILFQVEASQPKDTLLFATTDYCPFSCIPEKEGGSEGFLVDILKPIVAKKGYAVKIETLPFSRLLKEGGGPRYHGIVIMGTSHMPDLVYPAKTAGSHGNGYFVRKDSKWRYEGTSGFVGPVLGTVQGYHYCGINLDSLIQAEGPNLKIDSVAGLDATTRNLQKLLNSRIDVYLAGEFNVLYEIKKIGKQEELINGGMPGCLYDNYTAFNPSFDKAQEFADFYTKELLRMKKSGELKKIMDKYGLPVRIR